MDPETRQTNPSERPMAHRHTIHRHQHHFGWNNAIQPALRIAPGARSAIS
jgi:hypothetical protein